MEEGFICSICGKKSYGWGERGQHGNNPHPIDVEGDCCNRCNMELVIPARIKMAQNENK